MTKKSRSLIKTDLYLKPISAKTDNQLIAIKSDNHMILSGEPGTGKTFLAMYKAFSEVFNTNTPYKSIVLVRSAVATRNIGYLPGSLEDKTKIYEEPFIDACNTLFGREDAYAVAKSNGLIEFITTTNIRGKNLKDCVVIVDEFSNCNYHELRSVITRMHDTCRVIFSGDFRQSDIPNSTGYNRFLQVISSLEKHPFDIINFTADDIVRSGLVKEFIINESCIK